MASGRFDTFLLVDHMKDKYHSKTFQREFEPNLDAPYSIRELMYD